MRVRNQGLRTILIAVIMCLSVALEASQAFAQCGVERWPIKTLTDGADIDTAVQETTIKAQNALKRPAGKWLELSRQNSESMYLRLTGKIIETGEEADHDYHLVISDGRSHMIAEIPDPSCPGLKKSPYARSWKEARAFIDRTFGVPGHSVKAVKNPKCVAITGPGFFDRPDHGSGHSVNGREIHPVLEIGETR